MALGCRKCGGNGGKLNSESFLAHLAALVGETARHVAAHATNDRAAITTTPSALPGRAWLASEPVDGTPGHTYLVARRVWPAGERFPASCAGCRLHPRGAWVCGHGCRTARPGAWSIGSVPPVKRTPTPRNWKR